MHLPRPPALRGALALLALLALASPAAGAAKSIVFTHVPAIGQATDKVLSGRTFGIDPATARIALYIQVDEVWWTKPSFSKPLTSIAADGSWSATIAPVASDTLATQIVALVVPVGFVPPEVGGEPWLPDVVTQAALASTEVVRPNPARRNLHWCGQDWWVRDSGGERQGPGTNLFSSSDANVSIDTDGLLHLSITGFASTWTCAEIVTYRTLGLGRYVFRTAAPSCNLLDAYTVLGLFTWSDGTADPYYREIDIEWSRWGEATDKTSAQFVVQPHEPAGHLKRITIPTAVTELTQEFTWRATGVDFLASGPGYAASWSYPPADAVTPNLPASRDEKVHLNFWLNQNTGPLYGRPVEVVLRSFSFQGADTENDGMPDAWERAHGLAPADPADAQRDDDGDGATNLAEYLADTDPADPASLFQIKQYVRSATTHELTFTARPDKLYDIETSTTLASDSWTTAVTGLSGSAATITTALPDPGEAPRTFYRVRVQPQP